MKNIIFILTIFIFLVNCQYEDPFKEYDGKNLISKLDLTNDWIIDSGVNIDATGESPPSGYSKSYYFYFINLLDEKSSNFETSSSTNDTGNWVGSPDSSYYSKPSLFEVVSFSNLQGNKSLHIQLNNNPLPQYIYYQFTPDIATNYNFKFDYYSVGATSIGLSFGLSDNSEDNQIFNTVTSSNSNGYVISSFASIGANPSQIRFGFKENKNWESGIDVYIDKIAIFRASNLSIYKLLNIVESNDRTDDKTGSQFPEGVYRFSIYAKSHTSNFLTLRIGGAVKTFTLTNSWKKYSIETQILRTEGFLRLEIMPTSTDDKDKFPGGIFITKPELYLLYDKSNP